MSASRLIHSKSHGSVWGFAALVSVALSLFLTDGVAAQIQQSPPPVALKSAGKHPAGEGVAWSALRPNQQSALRPLEGEWDRIDATRKNKWLEIANKFPSMSAAEQARIQARMTDWTKLTPRERSQARLNFREVQQVPAPERKAKWDAYQALPPDQQQQLAARAAPAGRKASAPTASLSAKSNTVPNPAHAPRPKAIAATVVQAQPGATTNLITKRPSPPAHQKAGMPKIAVAPGYVDQLTLLPKRGPQGAATRSAAASAPASHQ